MNNFTRLVLSLLFVAFGCSQAEFLYAAQQPHKRKEEAVDEPSSKKPREEEKEEKTDADREEKEMGDFPRPAVQISDEDSDDEVIISPGVEAITSDVRDEVIQLFLSSPCSADPQQSKNLLLQYINSVFCTKGLAPTENDCRYLYRVIDAHLTNYIYPALFYFFDLYLISNKENFLHTTPGELAAFCMVNGYNIDSINDNILNSVITYARASDPNERATRVESILQNLHALNLSYNHVRWLSDISPVYKRLFMGDDRADERRDGSGRLLFNQDIVNLLNIKDLELIQKFIQDDNKRTSLRDAILSCDHGSFIMGDYEDLINAIGLFRYRFYTLQKSFDFLDGSIAEKIDLYRDVIENYAAADINKNRKAGAMIERLGYKLGLPRPSSERESRLRELSIISSFCNEIWKKFNTFFFSDHIKKISQAMMQFEIRYASKINPSVIDDLNAQKEELFSEVSKLKITTFKAYTKALGRMHSHAQEIIVNRDLIANPHVLLDHILDNDGLGGKLVVLSQIPEILRPITISYLSDNGVDHTGINRTMNAELARSFLGDSFFSSNGQFALPKTFNEFEGGDKKKYAAIFLAIGSWLSIIFVNNIAVPLPLPEVFYAALKREDLKGENSETLLKLAEYLKRYDNDGFKDHYRELFNILLYGYLDQVKEYFHNRIGWDDAQCAEFTDQNKIHKVMNELILPLFYLVPEDAQWDPWYAYMQGGGLWRTTPIQYQDYLVNFFNNLIAMNSKPTSYNSIRSSIPFLMEQFKGLLINLFQWLSPYDFEHFFPQTVNAADLAAHLEFNKTDLGDNQMLIHAADIFEQALHEYINENRDNQEKLQNLVGYFTGSPVYGGQQLKIHFSIDQTYPEDAHTCYTTVDVNLRMVDEQGAVVVDRAQDCQQMGDDAFKNSMKELIATWHGNERFSLEQQLQQQPAAAPAELQPI
ncbi:MAG: hypothetical protein WC365_00010 [Candidatus Babeliales bacterium]|jgi:hypothetical protein